MTIGTIVGLWENRQMYTVGELYDEVVNRRRCIYTPQQLCDWRYATCLNRFRFDPFDGEKIDWKQIKYFLENGEFQKQS